MNNELMRKKYDYHKKLQNNLYILRRLQKFIEEHANKFSREEAKQAIKDIKDYIEKMDKDNSSLEKQYDEIQHQLESGICKHEILTRGYSDLTCMLCQKWFFEKDVNFDHFLLENSGEDPQLMSYHLEIIDKIIEKIVYQDEDIMEVFEDYIKKENMPKIKVNRRISK